MKQFVQNASLFPVQAIKRKLECFNRLMTNYTYTHTRAHAHTHNSAQLLPVGTHE
jgi:hypothetical protein